MEKKVKPEKMDLSAFRLVIKALDSVIQSTTNLHPFGGGEGVYEG